MQQIISKDGTPISFQKTGSGPALLLVHGTTADLTRWTSVLPRFDRHFSVYAMNRRGRGESGDAPDYHLLREAEDVAAVVEAIGEPAFVLGHSYGAKCSLEAALLTGGMRRLILYEPPVPTGPQPYPPSARERVQALVDRGEPEAALETFMREVVGMPAPELETFRQLPVWQTRIRLAHTIPRELRFDWEYDLRPERFADLDLPVLLLLGEHSPPYFRQAVAAVAAALPNGQVVILPGQRHVAMDTDPELFVQEVLRFLVE